MQVCRRCGIILLTALGITRLDAQAGRPDTTAVRSADSAYQASDWARAIAGYDAVLRIDSTDARSWLRMGIAFHASGQWESGNRAISAAAKLSPVIRPTALYYLAAGLGRAGAVDSGVRVLEAALAAGYLATRNVGEDAALEPLRRHPRFLILAKRVFGPYYGTNAPLTPALKAEGIGHLVNTIRQGHPAPYRNWPAARWDSITRDAVRRAPAMSDADYLVTLMRLGAAVGDVHTSVTPRSPESPMQRAVPLSLWKFPEGLYVRATDSARRDLLGAEIIRIDGAPVSKLWPRLIGDFLYENEYMSAAELSLYLRFPDFLRGVGVPGDRDELKLSVRMPSGAEKEISVPALNRGYSRESGETRGFVTPPGWIEVPQAKAPRWLARRGDNYFAEIIPGSDAVYLQLNMPRDDPRKPWGSFLDSVVALVTRSGAQRLVIDLRHNGGGWAPMAYDLTWRLKDVPRVNQPGHLFVLIGRITQSAGVTIAAALERDADAVFIGEPLGAHPNFFNGRMGNHPLQWLPGPGIRFRISEVAEQNSFSLDARRFIAPDFPAPLTWSAYTAGTDPALELALGVSPSLAASALNDLGGRPLERTMRWQRPSQYGAWGGPEDRRVP